MTIRDEEFAELRRRFEEGLKDTRLRSVDEACARFADGAATGHPSAAVVEPPYIECGGTDPSGKS